MKKMYRFIGAFVLLLGIVGMVKAAQTCQKSDIQCYESGPSQNLSTPFRIDASGNVTAAGSITSAGIVSTGGQFSLPSFTLVQTTNTVATSTGTMVFVTNGVAVNGAKGEICMSTGTTTTNQWVVYPSSLTALTVCQ